MLLKRIAIIGLMSVIALSSTAAFAVNGDSSAYGTDGYGRPHGAYAVAYTLPAVLEPRQREQGACTSRGELDSSPSRRWPAIAEEQPRSQDWRRPRLMSVSSSAVFKSQTDEPRGRINPVCRGLGEKVSPGRAGAAHGRASSPAAAKLRY
jgi:hypothetical protein